MYMRFFTDFYAYVVLYWASAQQERCGFIGNSDETAATPSRAQQFYLDTGHPADCTGIVTGWRVCYYGPDSVNSVGSYFATFAVYRKMGAGDSAPYNRVTEIPIFSATRTGANFTGNSLVDTEIIQGGFNCYNSSIVPFTIQAGDVLGACVFDPDGDDILPLDVVSNVTGESLLQMAATSECSVEAIPSPVQSAGMQGLSMIDNRRLHIYANIGKLCYCYLPL